jgi:hypothetical protein
MDSAETEGSQAAATPASTEFSHRYAEYEFSEQESRLIARLARKMRFVGLFALAIGILVVGFGAIFGNAGSIISGALYALIGIWTHRASVSFRHVADTRGRDISNLMHALHDLQRLYTVQFWICLLTLIASLVALSFLIFHLRG